MKTEVIKSVIVPESLEVVSARPAAKPVSPLTTDWDLLASRDRRRSDKFWKVVGKQCPTERRGR